MYYNSVQPAGYRDSTMQRSRRTRHLSGLQQTTTMVARKKEKTASVEESVPVKSSPSPPAVSFGDLSPVGKVIAGTTQVVVTTALDFIAGFFTGYFMGTVVGVPGLLFSPLEPGVPKIFMTEMKGRLGRMNSRSMSWGTGWGGMSAAFGGFKAGVLVLRDGKYDTWNEIFSSAAAGAYFARKGGSTC